MKKIIKFILLLTAFYVQSVNAADNAIKMAYNFTTVSQTVVFNSAMQAGGTLQLSAQIADGGGRNPGDPITLKLVFYNSSNQIINTVQQAYTLVLGAAATTYSVTATNCGSSCLGVAYVSVQFYGKDGGYWAGNYGPYIQSPLLTFNSGSNILYNPEFGVYGTNGYAQGWASTAGWQNCALYSGSATCVINNGAVVNGGNYSASGGTTSGTSGGYVASPPAPTYTSSITTTQQSTYTASQNKVSTTDGNSIYIDQVGSNNTVTVTQVGTRNKVAGTGQAAAPVVGDGNTVTVRQGDPSGTTTRANVTEFGIYGSYNTVNLNQGTDSTGAYTGQDVGGHYIYNYVNGSNNSVTASQQNTTTSTAGQFLSNTVNGNNNTQNFVQSGASGHQIFSTVTGDSNTMSVAQSGNGGHYLSVTEYGNGNDAQITQTGNTKNNATINLTNNGAPASVTLQQSGGATYNIDRTCTSTCGRVTVSQ